MILGEIDKFPSILATVGFLESSINNDIAIQMNSCILDLLRKRQKTIQTTIFFGSGIDIILGNVLSVERKMFCA